MKYDYILKIVNAVMENFDRSKVKEKYGPLTSTSSSAQKHQGTYKIPADSQELPVGTTNYAQTIRTLDELDLGPASVNNDDVSAFMSQPLSTFVEFDEYVVEQDIPTHEMCPNKPPYDLSGHPDAETGQIA